MRPDAGQRTQPGAQPDHERELADHYGQAISKRTRHRCKTVSRKQALETGADIRVEGPHSVNGGGYRTPRMARNGAVCATTTNSERETRLVGWGTRIRT